MYQPLACYRVHDNNDSLQNTVDRARFDKMSRYFAFKLDYFAERCRMWGVAFDPVAAHNHSIWPLECRLFADKLSPDTDILSRVVWCNLYRALKACMSLPLALTNRMLRAV